VGFEEPWLGQDDAPSWGTNQPWLCHDGKERGGGVILARVFGKERGESEREVKGEWRDQGSSNSKGFTNLQYLKRKQKEREQGGGDGDGVKFGI
jgi:hypothetical protein